jgi:hypothetical protein
MRQAGRGASEPPRSGCAVSSACHPHGHAPNARPTAITPMSIPEWYKKLAGERIDDFVLDEYVGCGKIGAVYPTTPKSAFVRIAQIARPRSIPSMIFSHAFVTATLSSTSAG